MEKQLLAAINSIVQFGLNPNLNLPFKIELLEKNLVNLYSLYFEVDYTFDETDFADFDKTKLPDIRENTVSNFPEFGLYRIADGITDFDNADQFLTGDAIDDLSDIIMDLLEVKWRIKSNSLADGFWCFKFSFETHMKQHVLDLLSYMSQITK